MGKARDLFKKIRDTKGTFHAKMGSKMDRNCMILTEVEEVSRIHRKERNSMGLTEAEDINKSWQEYTEELYTHTHTHKRSSRSR